MPNRCTAFSCALLLFAASISPAGNGKITGRVKSVDGSGIPATIVLQGTPRGAIADTAGWFLLLDVRPGIYDLTARAVGFQPATLRHVRVSVDETITMHFRLIPGDISMPEVVIEGGQPTVEANRTSAKTTFDGDEIQTLPVAEIADLLSTAPGVYGPFIRGAHQYDSRVYVDGVDVTDRSASWAAERIGFSNATYLENTMHVAEAASSAFILPSTYGVSQATVYAGMANADYGTAPGIVSYTLKDGRGPWHGRIQYRVSQLGGLQHAGPSVYNDAAGYILMRNQLAGSPQEKARDKAASFTWCPGKYAYGGSPTHALDFGLGGSLTPWMGVYLSGAWFDSHGRLPNERTRKANLTAKLTFSLAPNLQLDLLGIAEDRGRLLRWKNQAYLDWYRFYLEGVPRWDGLSAAASVRMTHFLSGSTFYEVQMSYSHDNTRRGFCDDNGDGVVSLTEDGDYLTWEDTVQVQRYFGGIYSRTPSLFFSTPDDATADYTAPSGLTYKVIHPIFLYEDYTHRTLNVRGTLTSQILPHHELSAGGEFRQHWLDKLHRDTQWAGLKQAFFQERWSRKPLEFSGFVQDRMEFAGLAATIGFRMDGLDVDAADIADYFAPRRDAANEYGVPIKVPVRGEKVPLKVYISPRFGISHPVSERTVVYFSMASTVSPFPFASLYYNYDDWLGTGVVARIDQDPLRATTYDLGFQWIPLDGLSGSLALYIRDMENYSTTLIQPVVTGLSYFVAPRTGFANTKGVEVSLEYGRDRAGALQGLRARMSYTFSSFHLARTLYRDQWQYTAAQCSTLGMGGQLPFRDMQSWDRTYGRDYSGRSTMLSGFDRTHRCTFSLNIMLPYEFRLGCTGTFASGFHYPAYYDADKSPERYVAVGYNEGPWNKRVDMRLEKILDLPGLGTLGIFVDLINAFNWTNILTYFEHDAVTFNAWAINGDPTGGPAVNQPVTQEGSLVYGVPREVYFGVNLSF